MGHTITVRVVKERDWSDDDTVGFWNSQNLTISVLDGLSESRTQQIFCHELVHAILSCMGEEKLNCNEKFVDLMGSLFHQVWTSCEGAPKKAK
jgi:hypothetical protein